MKTIAFDARWIIDPPSHGIARYSYELLSHLKIQPQDVRLLVLIQKGSFLKNQTHFSSFDFLEVSSKPMSFFEQLEIPWLLRRHKVDLYHSPSFVVPFFCPTPFVITLHDMNHLARSRDYGLLHGFYYRFIIRAQLKWAWKILSVSEFSKREIVKYYGSEVSDKIEVYPCGVSPLSLSSAQLTYLRQRLNLPENFYFCLSSGKRHKNISALLRAYMRLKTSFPLLVAGALPEDLRNLDFPEEKILLREALTEEELAGCYTLCRGFLFPSLYEGFGLPPLEALSYGALVMSSKTSSMPEVLGSFVEYFPSLDEEGVFRGLQMFLQQVEGQEQTREERKLYSKKFPWKSLSDRVTALYSRGL